MAETKIVTKNSIQTGDTPSNLLEGELAVNIPDKRLFVGPVGNGAGVALNDADGISYNNSASGLTATNIQTAIDELDANVDAKPDQGDVDAKANTADLGAMAYEADTGIDGKDYVRKDNAWSELTMPPEYANPFGFLFGRINSVDGSALKTSGGFSSSGSGGTYNVVFDTPMTTAWTVVVSLSDSSGAGQTATVTAEDANGFTVFTSDAETGVAVARSFTFQVMFVTP